MEFYSERLKMRAIVPDDLHLMQAWINDPETARFLGISWPVSPQGQRAWLERLNQQRDRHKLILEHRESQTPIGILSFTHIDPLHQTAEIGITLGDRAYRGQGLGREAVSHGLDILFRHFNIHRVTAHILETNTRSVALFEQVGFQHDGLMREDTWWEGRRVGTLILSKLRSEHMFNPTPTDTP